MIPMRARNVCEPFRCPSASLSSYFFVKFNPCLECLKVLAVVQGVLWLESRFEFYVHMSTFSFKK